MAQPPDSRVFTFADARGKIPEVLACTREAMEKLAAIQEEIDDDTADGETAREDLQRSAAELLEAWANRIRAMGAEVKGPWLVDFDSGAGYYCWKWPEEALEFFHGYDEGFSGRLPIQ